MMLALLAAISRASCEERLAAAYRLLLWQSGGALLPRRLAVAYVRLLKVWHCTQQAHRQAGAHPVLILLHCVPLSWHQHTAPDDASVFLV